MQAVRGSDAGKYRDDYWWWRRLKHSIPQHPSLKSYENLIDPNRLIFTKVSILIYPDFSPSPQSSWSSIPSIFTKSTSRNIQVIVFGIFHTERKFFLSSHLVYVKSALSCGRRSCREMEHYGSVSENEDVVVMMIHWWRSSCLVWLPTDDWLLTLLSMSIVPSEFGALAGDWMFTVLMLFSGWMLIVFPRIGCFLIGWCSSSLLNVHRGLIDDRQ